MLGFLGALLPSLDRGSGGIELGTRVFETENLRLRTGCRGALECFGVVRRVGVDPVSAFEATQREVEILTRRAVVLRQLAAGLATGVDAVMRRTTGLR